MPRCQVPPTRCGLQSPPAPKLPVELWSVVACDHVGFSKIRMGFLRSLPISFDDLGFAGLVLRASNIVYIEFHPVLFRPPAGAVVCGLWSLNRCQF